MNVLIELKKKEPSKKKAETSTNPLHLLDGELVMLDILL